MAASHRLRPQHRTDARRFAGRSAHRKYRFNRTAPLIFSPADPHVLYLGSNVLFSTRDGGNSWQIISPDLTREDPGVPETLGPFVADDPAKGKHRGVIYSVAPSHRKT
jgi:hypothetical protein